ncbi:unnamed protein product [Tenebrio molitor]|nr:unnamed protein product [Tenebrio molitor]
MQVVGVFFSLPFFTKRKLNHGRKSSDNVFPLKKIGMFILLFFKRSEMITWNNCFIILVEIFLQIVGSKAI